jgi:hypothetical protein
MKRGNLLVTLPMQISDLSPGDLEVHLAAGKNDHRRIFKALIFYWVPHASPLQKTNCPHQ